MSEHVDLRDQCLICLLVGGNSGTVCKAPAFDDPGKAGLLVPHLWNQRHSISTVGLEHGLEVGQARGEPSLLHRVDIVRIRDGLQRSMVVSWVRVWTRWHWGTLVGLGLGIRRNLLKPGDW